MEFLRIAPETVKATAGTKISVIEGNHVLLREVQYEDADFIVRWRNDSEIGRFLQTEPLTKELQIEFLRHYFERDNDFYFVAESKKLKQPLGTVAVYNIDARSKRADFGRLYVLDQYKIYALEVSCLALQFAFETLKLHKVCGQVQKENIKSLRFVSMLGFHEEGALKEHWWNGKKLDDLVLFAMFKQDYERLVSVYASFIYGRKS